MYDDLLGSKKKKPSIEDYKVVAPTPRSAKWSIEDYEQQPYCYQCGGNSITMVKDKLHKGKLVKAVQCNTCFAEWIEVWNANSELESIGFKF